MPTFSFRIRIESRVVNNGAAKPSAVAEPSDRTLTARNQHSIEPNCDQPALQMLAVASRPPDAPPGARQYDRRDAEECEQGTPARDLAERVRGKLPFHD